MPNNKNNPAGRSQSSMGNKSDREFEGQGKNKDFGQKGQQAGNQDRSTSSSGTTDDQEINRAGGRQGQFSDKNRGSDAQWSPGSGDKLRE